MKRLLAALSIALITASGDARADSILNNGGGSSVTPTPISQGLRQVASCEQDIGTGPGTWIATGGWVNTAPCTNAVFSAATGTVSFMFNPFGAVYTAPASSAPGTIVGLLATPTNSRVHSSQRWEAIATIYMDASPTNEIVWVGFTQNSNLTGHQPPTGPAAQNIRYIALGCSSTVNGGRWLFASSDQTNESGVDTGVACTQGVAYIIDIQCLDGSGVGAAGKPSTCSAGVNGVYVQKATNLPSSLSDGVAGFTATMQNTAIAQPSLGVGAFTLYTSF